MKNPGWRVLPEVRFLLSSLERGLAEAGSRRSVPAGLADRAFRLAELLQARGPLPARETAMSLGSYLRSQEGQAYAPGDHLQTLALLGNLRGALALPSATPAAPPLVTPIAPSRKAASDRVALYVESRAVAALLEEVLSQAGYRPLRIESMAGLRDLPPEACPAAIVADLSLCRQDSELAATLDEMRRRLAVAPHLLCLASVDDIAARLEAVRLGATRFLQKPVNTERLIAILRGVTARTPAEPFRALLVDDDRALTEFYAATLAAAGVVVRTCNQPLAVPALVSDFRPDVIVTDVYMPGCNGLELAALLRQDGTLTDTPILFLSSETDIRRQMAALDLGADDFLTKPIAPEVLQNSVLAHAKRSRMLKRSRRDSDHVAEQLARIASQVPGMLCQFRLRPDGRWSFPYASQGIREIFGIEPEAVKDDATEMIAQLHPDDYPGIVASIGESARRLQPWQHRYRLRAADGGVRWLLGRAVPQAEDDGSVLWQGMITDITEQREAEIALEIAKERAEAASKAKSEFFSHMSHELRTPLSIMLSYAQLLEMGVPTPLPAEHRESVGHILGAGQHLLALIDEALDLSRIEAKGIELAVEAFPLSALLADIASEAGALMRTRSIAFQVAGSGDATVRADRKRLRQVLWNLLSNAMKYNRQGGSVQLAWDAGATHARVSVADTGMGIAAELQDQLFQPFNRLGAEGSEVDGTGIGLVLCKKLLEAMDGRIGYSSHPGVGSVFWVEIPLA